MNIVTQVTTPSQNIFSTLGGQIQIDEGRGIMSIYDSTTGINLVQIDRTGFLFSDGTNRRIKLGAYATRVGLWISKPGQDVITLLGG